MSANTDKASAGRNLLIYAGLVAAAAAFTVMVWFERPEIESYAYPTGLGDGEVYDRYARPFDPEHPVVTLDGVGYFAQVKPEGKRDRYMVKSARDDNDQYYLYRLSDEIGGGGESESTELYLKLGANKYIMVAPQAP